MTTASAGPTQGSCLHKDRRPTDRPGEELCPCGQKFDGGMAVQSFAWESPNPQAPARKVARQIAVDGMAMDKKQAVTPNLSESKPKGKPARKPKAPNVTDKPAIVPKPIERELITPSIDSIGDDALAVLVIDGVRKFKEIILAIIELRKRFDDQPRGHAGIAGCSTWTEFCEKKLGRTIRAIQKAIAVTTEPKPKPEPSPAVEAPVTIPDEPTAAEIIAAREAAGEPEPIEPRTHEGAPTPEATELPDPEQQEVHKAPEEAKRKEVRGAAGKMDSLVLRKQILQAFFAGYEAACEGKLGQAEAFEAWLESLS